MLIKDEYTIEHLKKHIPPAAQPRFAAAFEFQPQEMIELALQASEVDAEGIADALKIGVEHTTDGEIELAYQLAQTIVDIGSARGNKRIIGLGLMAQGDMMNHEGRYAEAWDKLEEAGKVYLQAGDEIGWARTRIGLLWISPELDPAAVKSAFAGAKKAEEIFIRTGRFDRLLRLYQSWAVAYLNIGQHEGAITYYQKAIETLERQEVTQNSEIMIAFLNGNIGVAYNYLGELNTAMAYLNQARSVLLSFEKHYNAALTGLAIANNYMIRGEYRQALHLLLNQVLPYLEGHRADYARLSVIECYLAINRHQEAFELAHEIVSSLQTDPNRSYQTAISALFLAIAQAKLGYPTAAHQSLNLAETKFADYENMVLSVHLRRGQIALLEGNYTLAQSIAQATAEQFARLQQPLNWIDVKLLGAEAALLADNLPDAYHQSQEALKYARQQGWLPARYRCYQLLGQILEKHNRFSSSIRLYQAALSVLRHIQNSLTISLRPNFLEDKLLPFHRLMTLYLAHNQIEAAFHTLEQIKSQVFVDYLVQREHFHWAENDETRPLLQELRQLRDKYRWLLHLQTAPPIEETKTTHQYHELRSYENGQQAVMDCEKRIRQLTEQLYLFAEADVQTTEQSPHLADIQKLLDDDAVLLEFYVNREQGWCIAISSDTSIAYRLDANMAELQQLVEDKWQSNLDFALQLGPDDPRTAILTKKAQTIGAKLYQILFAPISPLLEHKKRLVVVPYGFLHQLPFNILYYEQQYLIESHELVLLPSASLLQRSVLTRDAGALVAAHSWEGRLAYSEQEGQMVHNLMGGQLLLEEEANRELLQQPPRQILHISTHGQHRIDQPDFSYLELGDGPVYTDDLLQSDLSYELIVLSACELGRAHVTAGDELVGLGRGFLYAGAGALITGLWRVEEQYTYHLMEDLYRALREGASKAAALQTAQGNLLNQNRDLHPAFWAAFQLICNADPLTVL